MSSDNDDWGDHYEESLTVDGESYVEVGIRDPGNEGYHTIRIPFDEDAGPGSVEDEVADAHQRLEAHVEDIK